MFGRAKYLHLPADYPIQITVAILVPVPDLKFHSVLTWRTLVSFPARVHHHDQEQI